MDSSLTLRTAAGLALCGLLAAGPGLAGAAELPPGTRIDASNVDAVQADTFEGHRIADLMPPSMVQAVKEAGMASMPALSPCSLVASMTRWLYFSGVDAFRSMTMTALPT